jgi:hypothetical protein
MSLLLWSDRQAKGHRLSRVSTRAKLPPPLFLIGSHAFLVLKYGKYGYDRQDFKTYNRQLVAVVSIDESEPRYAVYPVGTSLPYLFFNSDELQEVGHDREEI